MFRVIFGIIVSLFMISLLRMIVGAITREISPSAKGPAAPPQQAPKSSSGSAAGDELRKCPACGTYHASMAVVGKAKSGEALYFCSLACREKFAAA